MLFSKKNLAAMTLFSALAGGASAQALPDLQDTATLDEFKRDFAAQTRDIPGSRFMAVTSAQATEEDKNYYPSACGYRAGRHSMNRVRALQK